MKTIISFSLTIFSTASAFCVSAPIAKFNVSDTVVETGQIITLQDLSTEGDASSWYYDEGVVLNNRERSNEISYSTAGTKTIVFTVTNPLGSHTMTKQIKVNENRRYSTPLPQLTLIVSILIAAALAIAIAYNRKSKPS